MNDAHDNAQTDKEVLAKMRPEPFRYFVVDIESDGVIEGSTDRTILERRYGEGAWRPVIIDIEGPQFGGHENYDRPGSDCDCEADDGNPVEGPYCRAWDIYREAVIEAEQRAAYFAVLDRRRQWMNLDMQHALDALKKTEPTAWLLRGRTP